MKRARTTEVIPAVFGTPFGGGFLSGRFCLGADVHLSITAPRKGGEFDAVAWHETLKRVIGAESYCDGLANTIAMAKAGSPIAKEVRACRIGGFDDWHIPSRLEQLMQFYNLQGAKTFAAGGAGAFAPAAYWSSTQYGPSSDYAWCQYFFSGNQIFYHKSSLLRVRLVRRVKL